MPTGRRCFNLSDVSCSTFRNQATEGHLFHSGPSVRDRLDDVIGRDQVLPALLRLQEDGRRQVDVEGGVETRTVKNFFLFLASNPNSGKRQRPFRAFAFLKENFNQAAVQFFFGKNRPMFRKKTREISFSVPDS